MPAVVGTTSSCDMTGFEASGPEVQVNGASKKGWVAFCHIFMYQSTLAMHIFLSHISFSQQSYINRSMSTEWYQNIDNDYWPTVEIWQVFRLQGDGSVNKASVVFVILSCGFSR